MYCRNCGNEVNDKAIACPKCGVNPRSEKKHCPSCGAETNSNQVVCTKCGVSLAGQSFAIDTSKLENIDVSGFLKSKAFKVIAALVIIGIGIYAYVSYSSHLHKGEAAELISQKFNFPSAVTYPLQHGLIRYNRYDTGDLNEINQFANKKIITVSDESAGDLYGNLVYQIGITPEGEKHKISDSTDIDGRKFYILKQADRVFGSVTGIKESADGKKATVEFTWGYANTTPIGEAMNLKKSRGKSNSPV